MSNQIMFKLRDLCRKHQIVAGTSTHWQCFHSKVHGGSSLSYKLEVWTSSLRMARAEILETSGDEAVKTMRTEAVKVCGGLQTLGPRPEVRPELVAGVGCAAVSGVCSFRLRY